ncbi:unnamed protein product [Arabidopsis halleri]
MKLFLVETHNFEHLVYIKTTLRAFFYCTFQTKFVNTKIKIHFRVKNKFLFIQTHLS